MAEIFDTLHEDHERLNKILREIGSNSNKASEKLKLAEDARRELEIHALFEEKEVYPAIQKAIGEEGEIKHAVDEHGEARDLVKSLNESLEKGDDEWQAVLKELTAAIRDHVAEEENDLFPEAQKKISKSQAQKMADDYSSFKAKQAAD